MRTSVSRCFSRHKGAHIGPKTGKSQSRYFQAQPVNGLFMTIYIYTETITCIQRAYLRTPQRFITALAMQTDERMRHHLQKLKLLQKHGKGKTERQTALLFKLWKLAGGGQARG